MFHIGAYSDIGPRKQSNQDSCCGIVAHYSEKGSDVVKDTALLAVCDGVGGLSSGEVASATVVNWLNEWFEQDFPRLLDVNIGDTNALFDSVRSSWSSCLAMLNGALGALGERRGARMGTTFTAILFVDGSFIIGHIGDTRVYRFRDGNMEILTEDQTWVAQEVARGNIPPEKARSHPKRNVILQSVGTQPDLHPEFVYGDYCPNDTFMVCCDGFRNELFDDELVDAFGHLQGAQDEDLAGACAALTDLVQGRGERDNVTAIATMYSEGVEYDAPLKIVLPVANAKGGE